jgi:hypothetical protein
MKKLIISLLVAVFVAGSFTGCVAVSGGSKSAVNQPTPGQQLLDLQKARDAGAITPEEYQAQKAKVLAGNK